MAETTHVDEWHGEDVSLSEVQARLGQMRISAANGHSDLRTSVMTHTAWVPKSWLDAARGALAGLSEAHPSRTILLVPDPDAERDAIDEASRCTASTSRARHGMSARRSSSSTVRLARRVSGQRDRAPADLDLPVFSRWRGRPSFGSRVFDEMVHVVDRLIVDSSEWDDLLAAYGELANRFDQTAVWDIAYARSLRWRVRPAERRRPSPM